MQLTLPITPFDADYDCDLGHDDVHAECDKIFAAFCNSTLLSTELLNRWRVGHPLLGLDARTGVANWAYQRFYRFAAHRDERGLRLLIELGAHEWARSAGWGDNALHVVVVMGHIRGVKLLLDAGLDPDAVDEGECTPLHDAVRAGRFRIAKMLLDRGADVNAHTDRGVTPLHFAAMDESERGLDLIRFLVSRGADVKATDEDGQTARDIAFGDFSPEAAELLRRLGG
jgi:ankyrin repeat protein